ncbi:hypothetical protein [Bacillus gobiensis]|uniref:hypothetical protein n=1 Tax=Bacillus gobiensis TaxID=1441095 RepID=UPI003D2255F3
MKLLDIFKKNVKTVEENEKELQVIREELAKVQENISEKQTQQGQLNSAISVVSAYLAIDPKDAEANKKKEQAEKKIAQLSKEIETLSQKQTDLQAQESEAQKAVGQSKGEVFKQEHIRFQTAKKTVNDIKEELEALKLPASPRDDDMDWAKAYGYPIENYSSKRTMYGDWINQKKIANNEQVIPVLREQRAEVNETAQQKADEISEKVMEYAKKLLRDEGIELD